jgi:molybdopterin-containing oxidoreductase family membrane subunit
VIPGFIPTPLGEIFEYVPTATEFYIAIGIWAFGFLVFTLLAKASIAIELGRVRASPGKDRSPMTAGSGVPAVAHPE